MISLRHRFLFVHIPKTAGNSIQNILKDYSEDRIVASGNQDGVERFEVRSEGRSLEKHSTLAEYYSELGAEVADGLFKFAVVRNPWDRLISFYFSPHRRETSWSPRKFRKFVEHDVRPLTSYFELENNRGASPFENVDALIRFENLGAEFDEVCEKIGIPKAELPVRNRSDRGRPNEYYDADLSKWVGERFAEEIEFFGWTPPVA
ncbi:pullulanase pulA [Haloferula helveola]|uniref:Pullulanase pulA n=1 Tax=Haloferula helveola TaxID=490095 RepID=A0ABM7RJ61_9BACT|nr:pullulanase pulA [Haloferula helveola]